ncbi:hypothetical protein BG015_001213 [Linnemannia schmuckeri]|uniref:Uncharacterized protein n=1 Tax=Linnemannia schmuckeri TaxID=64567 RepID=A0A9P5V776_9FUNG|nr:hypothetical protein BG015_001213 [Linnemannia schmuckeri]
MRISTFLKIALSLALGLAFTLHATAAPVQEFDLEQLQKRHSHDNTADAKVNEGVTASTDTTQDDAVPTKTATIIPCPAAWNPYFGHGPVCSKAAGTVQEVEKKKPQPLDFGLGP